jgi:hypothetical protein
MRRESDVMSGGHAIRNYLVFAILTIAAVIGASFFFTVPAAGQKKEHKADSAPAPCRLDGSLVPLPEVPEASGVVVSRRTPGLLWTHGDSGKPVLYALDEHGTFKSRVQVTGAEVQNWEDLAIGACDGGSCLYVGDIGDNDARRDHITVYRVPEPQATDAATAAAEAFHATYPDGPQDAEALLVSKDGGVFVITKGNSAPSTVYRFPSPLHAGAKVQLERVGVLAGHTKKNERVTGASTSPEGHWVALRTHGAVLFYDAEQFLSGRFPRPLRFDVASLGEPQGEGVAIGKGGVVFLVSEGGGKHRPGTFARGVCKLSTDGL